MRCSYCACESSATAKFCMACAAPLVRRCARCGHEQRPEARFCELCAEPLVRPGDGLGGASLRAADGERKTITALFADIAGSTAMMERLDPEEAGRIIDPTLDLMMRAVERYGGYVAQSRGDGIFALFGAPVADEDHSRRAVHAGLWMQQEAARAAERLRSERGVDVRIRIGINTGEVVVRSVRKGVVESDYVPIGHPANLAARLEALAAPGSVLVSAETRRFCEGYFQFEPLGSFELKGVSEAVEVYQVAGPRRPHTRWEVTSRRGLNRFVGRDDEIRLLDRALGEAKAGRGQLVAVVGEPGIGKSRLFHEFTASHEGDGLLLWAASFPEDKETPYLVLADLLRTYFELTPDDDEVARRQRAEAKVQALGIVADDVLPFLFVLLGTADPASPLVRMDAEVRRRRTFDAVKRLLLRESLQRPVVLIFEDLQWLDAESEAVLRSFAENIGSARVLLLVNYRPGYRHEWGGKTYYRQIRLDPFPPEQAAELLTSLVGDLPELCDVKRLIIEKTEGNPFFIEEVVQRLREEGMRRGDGGLVGSVQDLRVPPTVQGILAGRIDRLPPEQKNLLQIMAVIGREFSLPVLARVAGVPSEVLLEPLAALQSAEFIYERAAAADIEYTFKHALTLDVAYHSMLGQRRSDLHERAGDAIEELFADRLRDHARELASHYRASGNAAKAVRYLRLAGTHALELSGHAEAIAAFTAARELVRRLPPSPDSRRTELELCIALSGAIQAHRGLAAPDLEELNARMLELSDAAENDAFRFPVLGLVASFHLTRADLAQALSAGERMIQIAAQSADPATSRAANTTHGLTLFYAGDLPGARVHLERAVVLHDSEATAPPGESASLIAGMGLAHLAFTLWYLGLPDRALAESTRALALVRAQGEPFGIAYVTWCATALCHLRGEWEEMVRLADETVALGTKHGFPEFTALGAFWQGLYLGHLGQLGAGIEKTEEGRRAFEGTGHRLGIPSLLTWQAEMLLEAGRADAAQAMLGEALAVIERTGERFFEAVARSVRGEALLGEGPARRAEALACFESAIGVARGQAARSLELRATLSLGRGLVQQGRRDEARSRIAAVLGAFDEGFATADLRAARALLEEMSV